MKIFFAILVMVICTSFVEWPCHPDGDIYPCLHRVHAYDYDYWGNIYPCTHAKHPYHIYPCTHECY